MRRRTYDAEKLPSELTRFGRLHGQRSDHAGIVARTFDPDFAGQARRIDISIERASALKIG